MASQFLFPSTEFHIISFIKKLNYEHLNQNFLIDNVFLKTVNFHNMITSLYVLSFYIFVCRYVTEPSIDPSDPNYRHFNKIFEAFKVSF